MSSERQTTRNVIRHEISKIPSAVEDDPSLWWRSSARLAIGFRKRLKAEPDEDIKNYFTPYVDKALELLRDSSRLENVTPERIVEDAEDNIMTISREMATRFESPIEEIETHFIPLEEMVEARKDRFQIEDRVINGECCRVLKVRHPNKNLWHEVPLPVRGGIWHKGGPARAVLDIYAGSSVQMQESELPWNDFDVITVGSNNVSGAALAIGCDPEGIESLASPPLAFQTFCLSRDTNQNQVCLGADGLHYSTDAFKVATSGHIRSVGVYTPHRAIYGLDKTSIGRTEISTPRGLMRLVKAVVEGKADTFDYKPINANTDIGIYTLFLARKWEKRENFPVMLQKMYYLLTQMQQVREDENSIFDVLERAHLEYPFFDFGTSINTAEGVVRWKTNKFVRQIDREAGWALGIPSNYNIVRRKDDKTPKIISLTGFTPNDSITESDERWRKFRERSEIRLAEYNSVQRDPYERLFSKVKFDNAPDVFDESEFDDGN